MPESELLMQLVGGNLSGPQQPQPIPHRLHGVPYPRASSINTSAD
ncbi:hypothetical protein [Fodinicola feengrottensis]|nr:hypothetical protein [Fodinicola feengrottensis]